MSNDPRESLFQRHFGADEFRARRRRLFEAMAPGSSALLQGAAPVGGFESFRQTNAFYYLSGVEIPRAYLLLAAGEGTAHLFVPSRPEGHRGDGDDLWAEDADLIAHMTGLDGVHPVEALAPRLASLRELYVPCEPDESGMGSRTTLKQRDSRLAEDPWAAELAREARFVARLRSRFPALVVHNLLPLVDRLRAVKSEAEIALLRRAGRLSALSITEAMRATRAGMHEYELEAIAAYLYRAHGARGFGYRPIIPSGENVWYAHYGRNDGVLQDGEWLLMDCAPDIAGYTSDIGRVWPVNGTYSPLQRELYGFIVTYHRTLLDLIGPGRTADEIHAEAAERMRAVVERTAFSKPIYRAAAERTLEFKGHLSHPVGLCVHDTGGYRGGPLRAGTVFTVDPQMWIPEERRYVRCEDTILVTDDGIENFTEAAPLEPDAIEAEMRIPGAFPPSGRITAETTSGTKH